MNETPPLRPPTATPLGGIGNNLSVACPCGRVIAAPTIYRASCTCGRRFQAVGEPLADLDVWEATDVAKKIATYRVAVAAELLQPKAT